METKAKKAATKAANSNKAAKKKVAKKAGAKKGQAEAERKAKGASAAAGTKPVKRGRKNAAPVPDARKMPGAKQMSNLIDTVQNFMDKAKEISGKGRQKLGEGLAEMGLDKVSFSMARKLIKMGTEDPNELLVCLENFDHIREKLKIDDLAGGSLFKAREGAPEEEGEEDSETVEIPPATDGEGVPVGAPLN